MSHVVMLNPRINGIQLLRELENLIVLYIIYSWVSYMMWFIGNCILYLNLLEGKVLWNKKI